MVGEQEVGGCADAGAASRLQLTGMWCGGVHGGNGMHEGGMINHW